MTAKGLASRSLRRRKCGDGVFVARVADQVKAADPLERDDPPARSAAAISSIGVG